MRMLSPCAAAVLLSLAVLVAAQAEGWTTLTSGSNTPTVFNFLCAVELQGSVFYAPRTHKYSIATDSWAQVADRPGANNAAGCAAFSSTKAFYVGGQPATNSVHSLSDTSIWSAVQPLPISLQYLAAAASPDTLWSLGGSTSVPTAVSLVCAYTVSLDVWTTKASMPDAGEHLGATSDGGKVFVSGLPNLQVYTIATDIWSTLLPAPTHHNKPLETTHVIGDWLFVMGQHPGADSLHRYTLGTGEWTSLASPPVDSQSSSAMAPSGHIYYAAGPSPTAQLMVYYTGYVAPAPPSVVGDPLFTAFDGRSYHLELRPGVFNILSTPRAVVNALLQYFPDMPPEESTVLTHIGVVALYRHCVVQAFFSASLEQGESGFRSLPCLDNSEVTHLRATNGIVHTLFLEDDLVLDIVFSKALFVAASVEESSKAIAYLDFHVRSHNRAAPMSGMLSDLSTWDLPFVQQKLSNGDYYEVVDDCLFSLHSQSAARVFGGHPMTDLLC